jgi:ammonia channel protein AmtB
MTLWPLFVYYPLTHWVRGNGWLSSTVKVIDFAGGLTLFAAVGLCIRLPKKLEKYLPVELQVL